jgi:hypothetical protein
VLATPPTSAYWTVPVAVKGVERAGTIREMLVDLGSQPMNHGASGDRSHAKSNRSVELPLMHIDLANAELRISK